jgi:aspartate racemase
MIPSAFVTLPSLPLTPNGKVDRKALPEPPEDRPEVEREYVAPRDAMESRLAKIWEEILGIRPIGMRDNIFDLGVDSLIAARLFVAIEKAFGKKLPPAPLFETPTIEQLAEHLRERRGRGRWTSLVAIQPKGSRPPVFCVHGGAGTIVHLRELAQRLGPDQPFYGLQARGLYGGVSPLETVEAMAAHYIAEIRSLVAEGPYLVSGYCFGGVVAMEMAHQLAAAGQEVALIILLNTPAPARLRRRPDGSPSLPPSRDTLYRRIANYLADLRDEDKAIRWSHARRRVTRSVIGRLTYIRWEVPRRLKTIRLKVHRTLGLPLPDAMRDRYFLNSHELADRGYVPRPTTAPIALFLGDGIYDAAPEVWGGLAAGPFELHRIPGDHRGSNPDDPLLGSQRLLMKEPAVSLLAERLGACLDRVLVETRPGGGGAAGRP